LCISTYIYLFIVTATFQSYTLSLHDALPIFVLSGMIGDKTAEYASKQIDDLSDKIRHAIAGPSDEDRQKYVDRIAEQVGFTIHKYSDNSGRLVISFNNGTGQVDFESFDDLYDYLIETFGN